MNNFFNQTFFNNTVAAWLTALAILIASFIAVKIFKTIGIRWFRKWSERTVTIYDDFLLELIEQSVLPLAYIAALYFSVSTLTLSPKIRGIIDVAFLFACTYFILRIITAIVRQFIFSFLQKQENSDSKEKQAKGLIIVLNIVIWILGFVFLIDNLGYDVTTLVAGLGIGGIAIALAAQAILGDLFSYFVIFFDRPFEIGDFIVIDDKMGTIEYIGIKTTRIRALSGEQLVCSNTDLTNSRLHNYKRMDKRRIVFKLSIIYQSSYDMVKRVPEIVCEIIRSKESVTLDRGHFSGFGSSSLDIEFVYFIESPDYNFYMDQQQSIYLDIVKAFESNHIQFAYPTQTLYIKGTNLPANETSAN